MKIVFYIFYFHHHFTYQLLPYLPDSLFSQLHILFPNETKTNKTKTSKIVNAKIKQNQTKTP